MRTGLSTISTDYEENLLLARSSPRLPSSIRAHPVILISFCVKRKNKKTLTSVCRSVEAVDQMYVCGHHEAKPSCIHSWLTCDEAYVLGQTNKLVSPFEVEDCYFTLKTTLKTTCNFMQKIAADRERWKSFLKSL